MNFIPSFVSYIAKGNYKNYNYKMPYKKVNVERIEETIPDAKEAIKKKRAWIVYYIIIGTIVLFGINVAYETYDNMVKKYEITEN